MAALPQSQTPDSSLSRAGFPRLTTDQQKLLLAALNSNDRSLNMDTFRGLDEEASKHGNIFQESVDRNSTMPQVIDPHVFDQPSFLDASPSGDSPLPFWHGRAAPTFGNSLLPDLSNGHETDFDVDLPKDVLDVLNNNNTNGEKRKNPEDEDDEDDEQDSKRRDGEDKTPKKPGRKPLTAEPTTKRKAQNRAAQRAFRERKEQHLKDLEQKITDLQKVSQNATQENSLLRAQVMTLQSELQNYKKRLSLGSGLAPGSNATAPFNSAFAAYSNGTSGANPFDFGFDLSPTFGTTTDYESNSINTVSQTSPDTFSAPLAPYGSTSSSNSATRSGTSTRKASGVQSAAGSIPTKVDQNAGFSPGSLSMASYGFPQFGSPIASTNSPESASNTRSPANQQRSQSTSTFSQAPSPSSSTLSRLRPSSSCGTSPEPYLAEGQGTTEKPSTFVPETGKTPIGDLSQFQFDPSPFGAYRETQEAIFGDGDFSGGLYDDFLNMPDSALDFLYEKPATPAPSKITLMDDVARARDESRPQALQKAEGKKELVTTNKMWQELKTCSKFQHGDLDIDGLCSELSKKATCSETGAVIPKDEWEAALWRLVGRPDGSSKKLDQADTATARSGK